MTTGRHPPSRIPARGAIGLVLTIGGLGMLLSFRTPGAPGGDIAFDSSNRTLATDELLATEAPAATVSATPESASDPLAATPPPAEPSLEPGPVTATLIGDAIEIKWGRVQVAVTIAGDRILDVETLEIPLSDRRSARINEHVEPILREQAIEANSADFDVISGATYTSQAYFLSLQSALDQLDA